MKTQTLVIGRRRYVLVPERDFLRLQKRAGQEIVRQEFAEGALRDLQAYRKNGKAARWRDVKGKLGL